MTDKQVTADEIIAAMREADVKKKSGKGGSALLPTPDVDPPGPVTDVETGNKAADPCPDCGDVGTDENAGFYCSTCQTCICGHGRGFHKSRGFQACIIKGCECVSFARGPRLAGRERYDCSICAEGPTKPIAGMRLCDAHAEDFARWATERLRPADTHSPDACLLCGVQHPHIHRWDGHQDWIEPMSQPVTSFPDDGAYLTYRWDEWLDGREWALTQGEDFDAAFKTFQSAAHGAAKKRGLKVRTRVVARTVYVQAVPASSATAGQTEVQE